MLSVTRKSVFQRTLETGREKHNYKHPFLLLTGTAYYRSIIIGINRKNYT